MYDYKEVMKKDIKEYLNNCEEEQIKTYCEEDWQLYDDLWIEDSVTGNCSGFYLRDESDAKNAVIENLPLLVDYLEDLGCLDTLAQLLKENDWWSMDVTIRCGMLGEVCDETWEEFKKEKRLDNDEEM